MAAQTGAEKGTKRLSNYFKGVRAELKKVSWPSRKELINYTIVVLVICTIISLAVWLIDSGLHQILKFIIG
ncbi:preprotein translocase subunit SecE [Proteiniborus sp. MB09-C3]|uniref:preprotein translocase subunit SecE n=1 Tax=Proteiniborus sp. MB09-C3 TaxID=3050072 RepID=UPI002556CA11|nr:preprotein translocase subunit SecE [Proteiniborus sp. MB09-C3]WIV13138.1 preprotein translocase subunit SecE [Proteiniborus sp. MB09-C3]